MQYIFFFILGGLIIGTIGQKLVGGSPGGWGLLGGVIAVAVAAFYNAKHDGFV